MNRCNGSHERRMESGLADRNGPRLRPAGLAGHRRLCPATRPLVVLRHARRLRASPAGNGTLARNRHHCPHHDAPAGTGDRGDGLADHRPRYAGGPASRWQSVPRFQRTGHQLGRRGADGSGTSVGGGPETLRVRRHPGRRLVGSPREGVLRGDRDSRVHRAGLPFFPSSATFALGPGTGTAGRMAAGVAQAGRSDGLQRRPRPRGAGGLPLARGSRFPKRSRPSAWTTIRCSATWRRRRFPAWR